MNRPPLLSHLLFIEEKTLPQLKHDIDNASVIFALQERMREMHTILTYLTSELIRLSADNVGYVEPSTQPTQAPPPRANTLPPALATQAPQAPRVPQQVLAGAGLPSIPGHQIGPAIPSSGPGPGRVVDVIMTPSGTRVQTPDGASAILPVGSHVDAAAMVGPAEIPDGVILPRGGAIGPEAAAALAATSGGARNVTVPPGFEPQPG